MNRKRIIIFLFFISGFFVFPFFIQTRNDVRADVCTGGCSILTDCTYDPEYTACYKSKECTTEPPTPCVTGRVQEECNTCDYPGGWCESGFADCINENIGAACGNSGDCRDSDNDHDCTCGGQEEDLTPTPTITSTPIPTLTGSPTVPVGGEVVTLQNQVLYMNSTPLGTSTTTNLLWKQTKNLSDGFYVLSASVLTFAPSTGTRGVKVGLYNSDDVLKGELDFSEVTSDYVTKTTGLITICATCGGDYEVRLSANDGAEADFDFVSLKKQGVTTEILLNPQFDIVELTPISKLQPDEWGTGAENWGYVWGVVNPDFGGRSVLFMNSSSRNRYQSDGNFSWMRYEKGISLETGVYQISATVRIPKESTLTGGRRVTIALACNMSGGCPGPTAGTTLEENQYAGSVEMDPNDDFQNFFTAVSSNFQIGGGAYILRIFANDGSEVLVDSLKLDKIIVTQIENLIDEDFEITSPQTSTVSLPHNWIPYSYANLFSASGPRYDVYASDPYIIPIGSKDSVTVTIGTGGTGNTPQIKYTAKLAGAETHPDMYFKLRAIDDLAFMSNPNSAPTCESPGVGGVDLYVPMKADSLGVYTPVPSINEPSPAGGTVATVTADGWVTLTGMSAGKYYTLNLKAPKTRGTEMLEHALLSGGQAANQNYDWTTNALQPGDLPDPNNSNKQDCTVNSVDISLINSRLGNTDADSLKIADVSYDGVVNANDIAQVVGTLSTKPDDDN